VAHHNSEESSRPDSHRLETPITCDNATWSL